MHRAVASLVGPQSTATDACTETDPRSVFTPIAGTSNGDASDQDPWGFDAFAAGPEAVEALESAGSASAGGMPSVPVSTAGALAQDMRYSLAFVEALLFLVGSLVASTAGCQALSDAGIVPVLLPVLRDVNPAHVGIVSTTVGFI